MQMSNKPETVAVKEAASMLGVEIRTVRDWIKLGYLKSIKGEGNRRRVLRESIGAIQKNGRPKNRKVLNLHDQYLNGYTVPKGFDLITTYRELEQYTKAFAAGQLTFLLLIGSPGSGKTEQMKMNLGDAAYKLIENNASECGLYCAVYKARNAPIVLDDVDHFLKKPNGIPLVKALTQTKAVRSVSWESTTNALVKENVPRQYHTSSPFCMIGNQWRSTDPDMAAVQDRALPVAFFPSAEGIHKRVEELGWCSPVVWKFIGKHLGSIQQPTMRDYRNGMAYKKIGMDWKQKLLKRWAE